MSSLYLCHLVMRIKVYIYIGYALWKTSMFNNTVNESAINTTKYVTKR